MSNTNTTTRPTNTKTKGKQRTRSVMTHSPEQVMSERMTLASLVLHAVTYRIGNVTSRIVVNAADKAHATILAKTVMQSRHGVQFGGIPSKVVALKGGPLPSTENWAVAE